jgi:hypothetical protein
MLPFQVYDAQQALGFVVSQTANIEAQVYQIRYPSYEYASLVPVVTEGNEWARSTVFYSQDIVGQADWISGAANDIPYADIDRAQYEHGFRMAGIGYQWNLEEINVARMLGQNLPADKASAARRVAEKMNYDLALRGSTEKGWTGLINDAGVTAGDVAANGTGVTTWWANKTPDQILADINGGLTGVYTGSSETEMANTILLPTAIGQDLGSRPRSATSDTTILQFLKENNVYTQETGQPLMIRGLRDLATADPGGDGRVVIYRRDPEVLRYHLPMPYRFLPVWQNGPMNWMVPGIFRSGGTEIRLPKAVRYLDGVLDS